MVFVKHGNGRKNWGITRASQTISCYKCGTVIELGEFFYSRVTKRCGKNSVKHLCEKCYEKQFITV